MQPCQRKPGARVAKPGRGFPRLLRMAARAIGAELSAMLVLVAAQTIAAQPQESAAQVLNLDFRALRRRDSPLRVAGFALLLAMCAFQYETGAGCVIEVPLFQASEDEFAAIMFHMTARAIGLAGRRFVGSPVKAGSRFHPAPNFGMAVQASEAAGSGAEVVAGGTFADAFELLVWSR